MRKPQIIIGTLLIATLLVLGACAPAPVQPSHEQVTFQLSTDTTPGNTDEYDTHNFTIYLKRQQELYLSFHTEGAAVMVWVTTPSDEKLGYQPNPDGAGTVEDEGLGHLQEKRCSAAEEGQFRFTAPEPGFYLILVKSCTPSGEIDVLIEYWIQ